MIGSRVRGRRRRRGGREGGREGGGEEQEGVWRRLFLGEGDDEEEDEDENERGHGPSSPSFSPPSPPSSSASSSRDTGDSLIQRLHSLSFPYVSKLRGSFSHLLDFLLLSPSHGPSSFSPSIATLHSRSTLIEHHDSLAYERYRRKEWSTSSLPPSLYTTAGLQRPVVLPSSSSSLSAEEQRYWPKGVEGLPLPRGRRLKPEEMLSLAETMDTAERKGHKAVVKAIKEMVVVQKKMIEVGVGGEGEEEEEVEEEVEEDEEMDEEEGGVGGRRAGVPPLGRLLSRIGDVSVSGGGKGGGKGGGMEAGAGATASVVLGKAAHLLDRADSFFGRVVVKSVGGISSGAGGGGGSGGGK